MRKGRPKVALILTAEERQRLESLAHRSRSAASVARRARIILACGEGADSTVVARRLHVTPGTVCKWRGRFLKDRLDGLYDEPRPGAKRTITDEQVEQVIIRTQAGPARRSVQRTSHLRDALAETSRSKPWRPFSQASTSCQRDYSPRPRDIQLGMSSRRTGEGPMCFDRCFSRVLSSADP